MKKLQKSSEISPNRMIRAMFRLDLKAEILLRAVERSLLGDVASLARLLERPDVPVSKDELIEAAWPGLAVEQSNLTVQIAALRQALSKELLC